MDHIEFESGFVIDSNELNDIQTFLGDGVRSILTDLTHPGVLDKLSSEKIIFTGSDATLGIYYFTAYDQYGNRIAVPSSNTPNQPTITGLRPDFSQNGLLTTDIVGDRTFPSSNTYYLVVRYKESKNTDIPLINAVTREIGYLYKKSGYEFYLRLIPGQTNTKNVELLPVIEGDILLAQITVEKVDDSIVITADESVRDRAYVAAESVAGIITNPNAANYGETQSFEDHINSIGSGTVTSTNIHGLSAEDLGIDIGATGNHQKLLHVNGIRTDNATSTKSAFYPYYLDESGTDAAVVYISPLSVKYNECCVIGGTSFFPQTFITEYSYSFVGRANESYMGYYLFYVDSSLIKIQVLGPVTSESDANFTSILKDTSKFPICSLKWGVVHYTTSDGPQSNYGIVPGTFKDQRKFFNMSTEIIRPDEIFALTQFAPLTKDTCYLHNAKIVGTHNYAKFDVGDSKRLTFVLDGDMKHPISVTFTSSTPSQIVETLITAFTDVDPNTGKFYMKAYAYIDKNGYLTITAPTSICLTSPEATDVSANSAAEELGFIDQLNVVYAYPNIQTLIYTGERNGYVDFTYERQENMTDQGNLTRIDYYLGGGTHRYNLFTYDPNTGLVSRVVEDFE